MDTHIDKIITEANLRDVKVFDYSKFIDDKWNDMNELQIILQRNGIKDNKANAEINDELQRLRKQSEDWIKSVGGNFHRDYRIVVLLEEIKT